MNILESGGLVKKIVVAPDSFKGTMESAEVCEIVEKAIKSVLPETKVVRIPVADGGEGTVEAFLATVICGIEAVFSTGRRPVPFEEAKLTCREDLFLTVENIFRFYKTFKEH